MGGIANAERGAQRRAAMHVGFPSPGIKAVRNYAAVRWGEPECLVVRTRLMAVIEDRIGSAGQPFQGPNDPLRCQLFVPQIIKRLADIPRQADRPARHRGGGRCNQVAVRHPSLDDVGTLAPCQGPNADECAGKSGDARHVERRDGDAPLPQQRPVVTVVRERDDAMDKSGIRTRRGQVEQRPLGPPGSETGNDVKHMSHRAGLPRNAVEIIDPLRDHVDGKRRNRE